MNHQQYEKKELQVQNKNIKQNNSNTKITNQRERGGKRGREWREKIPPEIET